MSWYRTGTVAVTNGSKTVTGVGTLFTTAVNVGDAFALVDANLNPTGAWYEVDVVVSNTEITLKQSYAGTTGSNKQFCVFNMVGNMTTPSFAQRLATFFASFQALIDKPTVTPTAASIPIADANGDIDSGWIKDASTTVKGIVELATPAEVFAGTDDERAVTSKGLDYSYATLAADRIIYDGVNLETKFASEIAGYANVWAWIKARITAVNYKGLHIGDYVLFTMGSDTVQAQIAGIDTNYRLGVPEIGHHIDFISKDCMSATYQWNTTNNNNGNETNAAPYMVSALKASLDGLVTSLPAGLQTVVIPKKLYLETRYASGSTLTNSTGAVLNDIGKLWVPTEYEVYGSTLMATPFYSVGSCAQYPIFASLKSKKKGIGHNGTITNWWLANPHSGSSTSCCFVLSSTTITSATVASNTLRVPLCFRIG